MNWISMLPTICFVISDFNQAWAGYGTIFRLRNLSTGGPLPMPLLSSPSIEPSGSPYIITPIMIQLAFITTAPSHLNDQFTPRDLGRPAPYFNPSKYDRVLVCSPRPRRRHEVAPRQISQTVRAMWLFKRLLTSHLYSSLSAAFLTPTGDAVETPGAAELLRGFNDQATEALERAGESSERSVDDCSLHNANYRDNPTEIPLFDGSEYNIGGDGKFWEQHGSTADMDFVKIPSGDGGGCITTGPLPNSTTNIGPVRPGRSGVKANPGGQFAYNPRCLRRDLNSHTLIEWMTAKNLITMTVGDASHTILSFQNELQGRFSGGFGGMHAAGHAVIGGEATDPFSSPNDPSFFLHHTMIDYLYWIWQTLHPLQADQVAGIITILNNPPSRNAVKEDTNFVGVLAKDVTIGHFINTLSGEPLCYVYV
ncbi:conserved hypothetical protein [Verticillium alfalfae VaMs.102]|uniref:Tyrosinase copper-binding domain-containing protein n=1 Tax=Verticillium alfalfae (strain VaMs.102 / ATCC MYA-4576 / FGSC 10136) TaxID=526221 RepID=C9SZ82_VERA1|nr:conserved hypothetical protein [Verticillium alfalfae VaMs.102]EEY24097.1 conserved hypothetical protein [Verticillium alfalfae VaMs.102]